MNKQNKKHQNARSISEKLKNKSLMIFCFFHPILCFWFLVTFGEEVTKIQKHYAIFVYILKGKVGKTGKKQKENQETKVTKIPKTKRWDIG